VSANVAEETGRFDAVKEAAGGRLERARLFLSEVRNELKRVTWPSQKEVYATTVVVIVTSAFFGLYLFLLDYGINSVVGWILQRFGAA
jgi:preprotein translocase subunit SecE